MGLWPYYSNALLYGDYANEANLHTRTKVHGIVTGQTLPSTLSPSFAVDKYGSGICIGTNHH